jgi:hypothetical protein
LPIARSVNWTISLSPSKLIPNIYFNRFGDFPETPGIWYVLSRD